MIDWEKLELKEQSPAALGNTSVKHMTATLPVVYYGIGIDPGRNFGIAIFNGKKLEIFWGQMKKYEKPDRWHYGIEAVDIARNVLSIVKFTSMKAEKMLVEAGKACVEGAAYGKAEGQVLLAEIRFGFAFGLYELGLDVKIVPPATVRKAVTGNGNKAMTEFFPVLNNNAADAIGIAAYAAGYRKEVDDGK